MLVEVEQYQQWLRRKFPRTTTLRHYSNDIELFFTWVGKPPAAVTLRDVDAFIEHCLQLGHHSATINRRLAAVRGLYRFWAIESDEAPPNPVVPSRHFIPVGRPLPRDVEDAQLQHFFDAITAPRDRAIFLLMLRCGLRVGEICNLSMSDVYLQAAPGGLPRLRLHGKGGLERIVYLSAQPLAALKAWLKVRPKVDEPALFLNCFNRRLTVSGIQKRLAYYCHEVGIKIACHQFRHTFGRHLAEARVPVTTIQRLLGHARLRTTEVYIRLSDWQVQSDYQAAMQTVTQRLHVEGGAQ
jgi:site-specific recombinase XerD